MALGAWLRLSHLDLTEYKFDEAIAIDLTMPLLEGLAWPEAGLVSSVGIRNPPMLMYLLAPPLSIAVDPLAATAFVALMSTLAVLGTYALLRTRFGAFVALTAAALFATAPWAVLTGRKIWAQDLLPVFSVALLHCLFAIVERPKTRLAFGVPVLACVLWQLHFSAFAVLPVVVLIVLYAARHLHWTAFALGTALALVMLVPYAHYQITQSGRDLQKLRGLAAGSHESRAVDLRPVWYTAQLSGATGWSYVTGASDRALTNAGPLARRAAVVASIVAWGLLLGGFVMFIAALVRRALVSRSQKTRLDVQDERRMILLLWVGGIWAVFIAVRLEALYPHYFVLAYPTPFAIVALALDTCRRFVARWWPTVATTTAAAIVVAMCAAYSAFDVSFIRFLERRGGTQGDYGVTYRHKRDVAAFALTHKLDLGEAPAEIAQLVALRLKFPQPVERPPESLPPGRVLDVRDRLKGQDFPECEPERKRTFGPLVTCQRP